MDFFFLLLAFVLGIFAYAIAVRFVPGMQPGEEKLNELIASLVSHFQNNTAAVQANTVATQRASIAAATALPAVPSPAEIAAATSPQAVLPIKDGQPTVFKSGDTTVTVTWTPPKQTEPQVEDETPIQWASRTGAVPSGELLVFADFAHQAPASMTYADILTAYKAKMANPAQGTVAV